MITECECGMKTTSMIEQAIQHLLLICDRAVNYNKIRERGDKKIDRKRHSANGFYKYVFKCGCKFHQ